MLGAGKIRFWVGRAGRSESGAVAVEFGFLVWIILLMMMMSLEFGRLFFDERVVTNSVRDAARYLARVPDPSDATALANAKNLAMRGSFDPNAPLLIDFWDKTSTLTYIPVQVPNTEGLSGGDPILVVRVEARVPYQPDFSFLPAIGLNNLVLSGAHEERWIGE